MVTLCCELPRSVASWSEFTSQNIENIHIISNEHVVSTSTHFAFVTIS